MTSGINNNNVKMGKWHALAAVNIIIGVIAIILNFATVITLLYDWVDWIGIGIWGGSFFISAGSLTIQKSPRLMHLSILVIVYGYSLGTHDQAYYCTIYSFQFDANGRPHYSLTYPTLCDWRLAADITFVVLGCLALIINVILSVNAKNIIKLRVTVHNFVTTTTLPQTVYQVPVNNYSTQQPAGVVYQTQPGNPTGQLGYFANQPGYPTNQAGYPMIQPNNPVSQSGYATNQSGYPVGQPKYPMTLPNNPVNQSGYSKDQSGYPVSQPNNPMGQSDYPKGQLGYPANQSGNLQRQPSNPRVHSGYPMGQPGNPASQPSFPTKQSGNLKRQPSYSTGQSGYSLGQSGYPTGQSGIPRAQSSYRKSQSSYPTAQQQQSAFSTRTNPSVYRTGY